MNAVLLFLQKTRGPLGVLGDGDADRHEHESSLPNLKSRPSDLTGMQTFIYSFDDDNIRNGFS